MNLSNSSMELNGTLKDLRVLWEETKAVWSDPVSRDFEEHRWLPIDERVRAALRAMERLAPVIERVQHECE
ncbi:MAG TPA: hypothetical protein VK395_22060 [Gemmataceae bacterium]|nr:hypothetical protein [Gemmataceae bacterium]